jgi:phosphoglycolate phosphatase
MQFDTFIFDLDGTLIDSVADLATAVNLLRADLTLPPLDLKTVGSYVGDGATMLVRRSLPEGGFSPERLKRFLDLYRVHLLDETRIYPGMADFLIQHQGEKMAVVTNKPHDLTMTLLKKPDPLPVLQALRELQADAGHAVMIGDHHTDLRAGRAAGIKTCFCAFGVGNDGGEPYDFLAETPADLLHLFPAEHPW